MFTKVQYRTYLDTLSLKTRAMIYLVYDMVTSLNDEKYITMFKAIARDYMQNYDILQKTYDLIGADAKELLDRRRYRREVRFGLVVMTKLGTYAQTKARCIDVSLSGMCIESSEKIEVGETYEFYVTFYEKDEQIHLFGKIMWAKNLDPVPHTAGIICRAGVQFK